MESQDEHPRYKATSKFYSTQHGKDNVISFYNSVGTFETVISILVHS